jgi:hypothetical protein
MYMCIVDRSGTNYLATRCSQLLARHIQRVLPSLKEEIRKKIKEKEEELSSYGSPVAPDKSSQVLLKEATTQTNTFG